MNAPHELSNVVQMTTLPVQQNVSSTALMLDNASMDKMMRLADFMASGKSTLPAHLRGSPGDCLAVVMQAVSWNMNPYAVAQKTYIVSGALGYEAQLVAAVINNSGIVKDRFNFEWYGDWKKIIGKFAIKKGDKGEYRVPGWQLSDEEGLGIRVWATLRGESEPRVLELLLAQARTRNSTLWADDPKQQLAYLAQKRWARLYAPDVILGVYSPDEFDQPAPRDMGHAEVVQPQASPDLLHAAQTAAEKGVQAYQTFWKDTGQQNRALLKDDHERLKAVAIGADKGRTVETPPAQAATQPAQQASTNTATGEIVTTVDDVMKRLNAAKNEDALHIAADWMNALPDDAPRAALEARYDERLAEMRGA